MKPIASVIIPTRNRCHELESCLISLTRQTLPIEDFEVIVVDNGSNDATSAVASSYGDRLQLHCLHEPEPGLHAGRHTGMYRTKSDLLLYCDDDVIADPSWVKSIIEAFSDPTVALVGGNNHPLFEATPPVWLQALWERPVYRGRAISHLSILDFGQGRFEMDPGYVWGCNFAIRRQVLINAGGFHPDAMPPDRLRWRGDGETHVSDFIRSSGMITQFHSGASVQHRVSAGRMTEDYFVRRSYAQGVSDSYTDLRKSGRTSSPLALRSKRRFRYLLSAMRARLEGLTRDTARKAMSKIRLQALEAYLDGYAFHQAETARDPALFSWVTQKSYL